MRRQGLQVMFSWIFYVKLKFNKSYYPRSCLNNNRIQGLICNKRPDRNGIVNSVNL